MKWTFFFLGCFLALSLVEGCARKTVWDRSWTNGVPCRNRLYPLWTYCCQRPYYDRCGIFGNHLWDYVDWSYSWSHEVQWYYGDFTWDNSWRNGVPRWNRYYNLWNYCCRNPRCSKCGCFGQHLWDYVKYSHSYSESWETGIGDNYGGFHWDDSWVDGVPYGNRYYNLWNYCCQHPRCGKCGCFGQHLWDYVKYSHSYSESWETGGDYYGGFHWDDSWVDGVPYGNRYYNLWNYCCQHPRCGKCGCFGQHLWDYVKYSASYSHSAETGLVDYYGGFHWDDSWTHGVPRCNSYYNLWNYCCQHPYYDRCGCFGNHLWDYVDWNYSWSHEVEWYYGDFTWDNSWRNGVPRWNRYYNLWNYCCRNPRCGKCSCFGQHLWDYIKYSASVSVEKYYRRSPRTCWH